MLLGLKSYEIVHIGIIPVKLYLVKLCPSIPQRELWVLIQFSPKSCGMYIHMIAQIRQTYKGA